MYSSMKSCPALQGSQSWDQNQEFEDIFSQFFGGGGSARAGFGGFSGGFGGFQGFRAKGPDIHAHIRHVCYLFTCSLITSLKLYMKCSQCEDICVQRFLGWSRPC